MDSLQSRKCHKCGKEYSYKESANIVVFCPHCKHSDYVCCDFGFGSVTPCYIDIGDKNLGTILTEDTQDGMVYKLVSEEYGIDQILKSRYMEAIGEAGMIISDKISGDK